MLGFFKFLFFYLFDSLSLITPSKQNRKNILILRPDGIGDYIMFLDGIKGIRESYPKNKYNIYLVCNQAFSSLAKDNPDIDHIISFNRNKMIKDLGYRINFLKTVRKLSCITALYPVHNRDLLLGDLIIRISGAKNKITFSHNMYRRYFWEPEYSNKWYTQIIETKDPFQFELLRNQDFIRAIGNESFRASTPKLELKSPEPNIVKSEDYIVLFPGAGWSKRSWPTENFLKLVEKINTQYKGDIVICGGPDNIEEGRYLEERKKTLPIINLVGKTSLNQLTEIIRHAKFLVTNDTSAVHMGAAVQTKSFCILGGGNHNRFLPYDPVDDNYIKCINVELDCYGCNWDCIYKVEETVPCIAEVTVENVYQAINQDDKSQYTSV